MSKKGLIALCFAVFLLCIGIAVYAQERSADRMVSEKFITQIDFSSLIPESFKASPDGRRVAYVAKAGNKMFVVVDGKEEKRYDGIGKGSLIFSPDSKRVAYVAKSADKWFVVVDGKEEKEYDSISMFSRLKDVGVKGSVIFSPDGKRVAYWTEAKTKAGSVLCVVVDGKEEKQYDGIGSPIFSPDSKRVAYVAKLGNMEFVVVDGKEGKRYDEIVMRGETRIIFETPVSLRYDARKGARIYLVGENIE